ncbi:MAG: glucosaminidase domain-containing protein [Bacteroidetes bacterium]|nr:glucosaminidase domain-containing protein [Bacteroidota bacterium]
MKNNFIPASITLAQGMVETACGCSELARNANNHFGIKCHETWNGETYEYTDDAVDECFRKYETTDESYADHSLFLRSRERYAFLFNLRITDYRSWANGLKAAGYATNPKYADMLIAMIEKYGLNRFDYEYSIQEDTEKKSEIVLNVQYTQVEKQVESIIPEIIVAEETENCADENSFSATFPESIFPENKQETGDECDLAEPQR